MEKRKQNGGHLTATKRLACHPVLGQSDARQVLSKQLSSVVDAINVASWRCHAPSLAPARNSPTTLRRVFKRESKWQTGKQANVCHFQLVLLLFCEYVYQLANGGWTISQQFKFCFCLSNTSIRKPLQKLCQLATGCASQFADMFLATFTRWLNSFHLVIDASSSVLPATSRSCNKFGSKNSL